MFNRQLLRQLYIAILSAIGFFMPLSLWLLSACIILLGILWLSEMKLVRIADLFKSEKTILIFLIIYIVYLVWMINTSDINYGIRELRLKLPLLVLPLFIGLSDPLTVKELRIILSFFILGVIVSSLAGVYHYISVDQGSNVTDPRELSLFISNVRLALMTDMAIAVSAWYYFSDSGKFKIFYLAAALWLTFFLFILLSITGIILFFLILTIIVIRLALKTKNLVLKSGYGFFLVILFLIPAIFIIHEVRSFYTKGDAYKLPLEGKTINGNPYQHLAERLDVENGNLVWIYINEKELRNEWNGRSSMKYDSLDHKGQELKYTLIRYLTSAGLRKDSAGLSSLSTDEIAHIENGITNRLFIGGNPIRTKVYEILWQVDYYRKGGNPSGHSVTQRIEFFKTGWHLFLSNFLFGTGTGDFRNEMVRQYERDKTSLDPAYRFLPHNQYLTLLISFGLIGFLIICCAIFIPVVMMKANESFLFNMFFLVIMLSMLGEDTLETHAGVSFFAYFYSLFVFGKRKMN
jgi:hypothetical protein